MDINFSLFLTTLAEPPGDLIYHLVVSMTLFLTAGIAFRNLNKSLTRNQAQRILIGCGTLLVLQLVLFSLRFLNFSTDTANVYTLYERLAAVLTITWLVWVFFDDAQPNLPTKINILLSALLIILAGASIIFVPRLAQLQNFNILLINILWQFIALSLALIGLVLGIFIPFPQRLVMIFIMLLLAGGHITQILMNEDLQWSMGAVRLAQTLSLPWVMVLIHRFSKGKLQERYQTSKSEFGYPEMPVDTKPALINQLLKVNLTDTVERKYQAIVQALGLSVVADVCYLLRIPEKADKLHIIAGYDLIREYDQNPDTLVREDLPRIMDAWQTNQVLELSQDQDVSRDMLTLATLIKHHTVGNLFAYPLGLPNTPLVGGVIFLSPYTGKIWGDKTKQLMDNIHDSLSQILFAPNADEQARLAIIKVQQELNTLTKEQEQLHQALAEKEAQTQEKEAAIKALKAKYQIEKMETVTSIERLKKQIIELSSRLTAQQNFTDQLEQMKAEIRHLGNEREQLSLALSRANATIRDLQTQTGQTGPIRLSLDSQIISLDSIAANVRLQVASRLQQNDIDLEIHNPDGRQMIKTDPELLQTALLELLTNAIKASEPGGTIRLDQKLSLEMGLLIIQVTDFGDGLSQAEQTALFSAQHDSIPGIGDVHSIRNAIRAIRVLNGKIWLKSKKASYTTFRFQIPVRIID